MVDVEVLVVGAGPVGLTAAVELRRQGVDCRIIDRLPAPLPYAKAVGVQPRTLEIWDAMGLAREALDAAEPLRGQLVHVNGRQVARIPLDLPPDVPYRFAALPQYETERLLADRLAAFGTHVERGTELISFDQDATRVRARLAHPAQDGRDRRTEEVGALFLIGCDGAHSTVRKGLGLRFEGGAFAEEYMLGDVEVDWDLPRGYVLRSTHQGADGVDDLLVCVPLPGENRYRMSMLVPPGLSPQPPPAADGRPRSTGHPGRAGPRTASAAPEPDEAQHGLEAERAPTLDDIQPVLDRLAPDQATAANLRWSSVFRISHRLVDHYRHGRVFVAGDAAHIHPPTGAQGMNTGIQDAYNLAWKLALALRGVAAEGLLDSYQEERHPVGAEVVGRTVRHARDGFGTDPDDPAAVIRREAQLLIDYHDSPIVTTNGYRTTPAPTATAGVPTPGDRAPDCGGLHGEIATYPTRLFDLLRGVDHTLLFYSAAAGDTDDFRRLTDLARRRTHGRLEVYVILAPGVHPRHAALLPPVLYDTAGEFRTGYSPSSPEAFLIRPDGHLSLRADPPGTALLVDHLNRVFAPA
jgi:2-polyprenyl-6-methoxyphenol hydroxylase-like FAD-dependent oxidoreductase